MNGVPGAWTVRGKLCLVTGSTSGIGQAIAEALAARGARLLLVARDRDRGAAASRAISAVIPGAEIEVFVCDLARLHAVRELAAAVTEAHGRVDVVVHDAAVVPFTRQLTEDGLETAFAVNHLAPFLLTDGLRSALAVGDHARVVTVTSDNHAHVRSLPWDDLQGAHAYRPLRAYAQTKLMNVWFTRALAARLAGTGITANCCSPGFVRTGLARHATGAARALFLLARPFQSTPEIGARTAVHLATTPDLTAVNGAYFEKGRRAEPSALACDDGQAERLWALSARLCGLDAASG